jgi:hypothetical protein
MGRRPLGFLFFALLLVLPLGAGTPSVRTFTDSCHTFKFQYPRAYKLYVHEDALEAGRNAGYIPLCGAAHAPSDIDVCVIYPSEQYEGTNFSGASFQVRHVNGVDAPEACEHPPGKPHDAPIFDVDPKHPTKLINGITFAHGVFDGAAMSHYGNEDLYRTYRESSCWELSVILTTTQIASEEPGTTREFTLADREKVKSDLDRIVTSSRFLK